MVKSVAPIKQCPQISVEKGQQPSAHSSLITLLTLVFQIYLALSDNDRFYIVGLSQDFHSHIVIHAQEDIFQIRTGKPEHSLILRERRFLEKYSKISRK